MKPYTSKQKFTKDQLIFVIDVMITSAIDAVDSSRPNNKDIPKNVFNAMIDGILEKIGFDLSIFYAQVTGDGIGCCDVREITNMESILGSFADSPKKKINTTKIATKFVDDLFDDYLQDGFVSSLNHNLIPSKIKD